LKELSEKKENLDFSKTLSQKQKALWKLISKKEGTHQYTNKEIQACGIDHQEFDQVREAITRSSSFSSNPLVKFILLIFFKIGTLIDSIFRIILVIVVFLFSLQFPYVNERANKYLEELVIKAEKQDIKYQEEIKHYENLLKKYGIEKKDSHNEVSNQTKDEKKEADRWLKYKKENISNLWQKAWKDLSVLEDLKFVYKSSVFRKSSFNLINFSLGLPRSKTAYLNGLLTSVFVLFVYIVLQGTLIGLLKRSAYQRILFFNLNKALKSKKTAFRS